MRQKFRILFFETTVFLLFGTFVSAQESCVNSVDSIFIPNYTPNTLQPLFKDLESNSEGNYYLTGGKMLEASIFYHGQEIIGQGGIFLWKFNSQHELIWDKRGSRSNDVGYAQALTVDDDDDVIVGGWYEQVLTFGADTINHTEGSIQNPFISKFSSDGTFVWSKRIHTPGYSSGGQINSLSSDSAGNIFFGGVFGGTLIFGTDTIVSRGYGDNFWGKMNSDSEVEWIKAAGSGLVEIGTNVATDEVGNVYVYGSVHQGGDSVYFDNISDFDSWGFITKYSTEGNREWLVGSQTGIFYEGLDIKESRIDVKNGVVVVCGSLISSTGIVEIGGATYSTLGINENETFTMAIDTSGNGLWIKGLTSLSAPNSSGIGVEILNNGNVVVAVDRALSYNNVDFGSLTSLLFTLNGQSGSVTSFCNIQEFENAGIQNIESFGNTILINGGFGVSSINIKGWYLGVMEPLSTGTKMMQFQKQDFLIYPNPSDGELTIQTGGTDFIKQIRVIDPQGKILIIKEFNAPNATLNIANLDPGIYFISIAKEKNFTTTKIVLRN